MRRVAAAMFFSLLVGCNAPTLPEVVVPVGPAAAQLDSAVKEQLDLARKESGQKSELLQSVAGDVYGVRNAAGFLPEGNATEAVREQSALAAHKLPAPTADQRLEKERQNTLFLSGQLEAARAELKAKRTEADKLLNELSKTAQALSKAGAEVEELRRKANDESTRAKVSLQQLLDQKNREIQRAKDEAYAERNRLIFWVLCGLAAVCGLVAIALAVVTQGKEIVRAAIAAVGAAGFFGLAKTISSPWFLPVLWTLAGLGAVGFGFYLWHERRSFNATVAFKRTVKEVEKLKTEAPEKAQELLRRLGTSFDTAHKQLVDELRKQE